MNVSVPGSTSNDQKCGEEAARASNEVPKVLFVAMEAGWANGGTYDEGGNLRDMLFHGSVDCQPHDSPAL